MSILLAMLSKHGAVVATDSQRVECDGSAKLDYDKTFAIGDWLIGGSVGLLEFSGRTVADHVAVALGDHSLSPDECRVRVARYFVDALTNIDPNDVEFQYRSLEVVLIPCKGVKIVSVEFKPDQATTTIAAIPNTWEPWSVTGDDSARVPLVAALKPAKSIPSWSVKKLERRADELLPTAIAACGAHRLHPKNKSCGGVPKTRTLVK